MSHEQHIIRNMKGKDVSSEVEDRSEEHVIGKWRKDEMILL